jgi:hypothetical protein
MKNILNKAELRSIKNRAHSYKLNEAVNLSSKRSSESGEIVVFLSHKHNEKEEIEGAIALLNGLGVTVYVDWNDKGMPKLTSGATADRLKRKIKSSDKFILLATEGAISSKWCNWELGLGDADKYIKDIAILPIANTESDYTGTEYLQIYPHITVIDGEYYVVFQKEYIRMRLKDWLLK